LKSVHLIRKLTIDLPVHEQNGWTGDRDRVLSLSIVAALCGRGSCISFYEVQDEDHFEHAICLSDLRLFEEPKKLNADVPCRYWLQGLSLAGTSQAMFYQAIRESKEAPECIKTTIMLDLTRYAVRAQCNIVPTDEMIWWSIRSKDISRNICDFLWRCLHNSSKCDVYWRNIPGFEQFAQCRVSVRITGCKDQKPAPKKLEENKRPQVHSPPLLLIKLVLHALAELLEIALALGIVGVDHEVWQVP
jgi:ribonuclease HI